LAADVQQYLAGEPVTAYRETLFERSWRWIKKHRKALGRSAAAVVFAAVAVVAFVTIRQAQLDREEALRKSAELEEQARARRDLLQFRRLADETNFYAANADPMEESAPFFDPKKGEAKGQEALALAAKWGSRLDDFPLAEERDNVKGELANLLLLVAEVRNRYGDAAQARETLALLDQAAQLGPATSSFFRLRGACHRLLKDDARAKEDEQLAHNAGSRTTAMDHFLLAEQHRRDSSRAAQLPPLTVGKGGKEVRTRNWQVKNEPLEKALAEYRLAQAMDPAHYWSHYQLGRCYVALRQESEAVEAFTTCVALRPDTLWGYAARGFALGQLGRFQEAMGDLDKAIAMDRDFRPARLNRGIVAWKQKKYEQALKDFQEVLDPPVEKQLLAAAFFRGQLYMERHQYPEALADFDRVAAAKKQVHPVLYLHRARIFLVQGQETALLENLKMYLAAGSGADPRGRRVAEQLGRELRIVATSELPPDAAQLREKTYLLALAQVESALKAGNSAAIYGECGALEELLAPLRPKEALKRMRRAIAAYSKGIELDPKDVKILVKRGWAQGVLRQFDKARDDFTAALRLDPSHAEAHTGLGYFQACLNEADEANRHATQALLYGPGDHIILHNVACIYAKLAQAEPARAKAYQDMALDQLHRAVYLWEKGGKTGLNAVSLIRNEEAFDKALRARPEFLKLIGQKKEL
jgi:tetratricopeptide (TPR) repeat protein